MTRGWRATAVIMSAASLLAFVVLALPGTLAPALAPTTSPQVVSPSTPDRSVPTAPTYVILVHGWDPSTIPAYTVWTEGVDEYQQLVDAGYIVGVVSYYGTFTISFSNGATITDPSYFGTIATPIETVSLELGKEIQRSLGATAGAQLDLVGHSMGGLVVEYMLEHVKFRGITVDHVIFLGSPLNGAPVTALTAVLNATGIEASEMSEGSPFLTALHAWVPTARMNDPSTVWIAYAGDASPPWAASYFASPNDGLVDVPSATDIAYDHVYLFPDLHIPELDSLDPGHVSYFEDQNVADEMLANFSGHY